MLLEHAKQQYIHPGFTLIELLVVISILGLLASFIIVSLNNARIKARDTRRVANINQIGKQLDYCYGDKNNYPTPTTWERDDTGPG